MTSDDWRESILRRLQSLETGQVAIELRLAKAETKGAVDEVHRQNVEKRLDSIEGTLKWLVRLILGTLIMATITFIITGGISV